MLKSLSRYVFAAKYPKWISAEERRETWIECVNRVMDMHQKRSILPLDDVRQAYLNKTIAGSQRGLQFGGAAIEEKNARLYNCCVSYCDRLDFFKEAMWLLLCGAGVGISFQKHHVAALPTPKGWTQSETPYYERDPFIVEDSIEGWAHAADHLLRTYFNGDPAPFFDFSRIRPKGAALRHGGVAPGPEPLKASLNHISRLLELHPLGTPLKPIEAFDIAMHLADAVVSGGIRRSATIAVFSLDDEELLKSKTGMWFQDNPQRGRANISAMITPSTTEDEFKALFKATKEFGEPGFIFAKSTEYLYNPCVEIGMCPTLVRYKGLVLEEYSPAILDPADRAQLIDLGYTFESGWQVCNLTTINCSNIETEEQYLEAVTHAATLGTVQASYTSFPFLGHISEQIIRREALLGVSMTGILSNPMFSDPAVLEKGKHRARLTNKLVAEQLGIPVASRITCVKPEGTASIVLDASAGIHPYHSRKYIRRVQADEAEPLYQEVLRSHPEACFDSVWGSPTQKVICFPCEAPASATVQSDLTAIQHLAIAARVQNSWVRDSGSHNRCLDLQHNVSITISVADDEWEAVANYLWDNRETFTGVSCLPTSGDYIYQQPPFCAVEDDPDPADPHYEAKIKERDLFYRLCQLPDIVLDGLHEAEDNTDQMAESACSGSGCSIEYRMDK